MKAIVLYQPWASLVACGAKRYETRSWSTSHRGPLAICAASLFPREARELVAEDPFWVPLLASSCARDDDLRDRPEDVLPRAALIALSWVEDCVPTEEADVLGAGHEDERAFGDFSAGRYAWKLREPIDFAPVPIRGGQRLFNIADDLIPEYARRAIRTPGASA